MNTTEFKALSKAGDLSKVVVTCFQDSYCNIRAFLCLDDGNSAYNYFRDSKGQIVNFDTVDKAVALIRMCGYKGEITHIRTGEEAA